MRALYQRNASGDVPVRSAARGVGRIGAIAMGMHINKVTFAVSYLKP